MSWSRRNLLAGAASAAVAFALAGCGFAPVYGPNGSARGLQGSIALDPPHDAEGFALVGQLENRLGPANGAAFRLGADIGVTEQGLGITTDQEVTRFRLLGTVDWQLRRRADDAVVASGREQAFASYSAPIFDPTTGSTAGTTVSVIAAARDARDRLMVMLADRIVARLLLTAPDWRQ